MPRVSSQSSTVKVLLIGSWASATKVTDVSTDADRTVSGAPARPIDAISDGYAAGVAMAQIS